MGKLKRDRALRKGAARADSSDDDAAKVPLASRPTIEKKIRRKQRLLAKIEEAATSSGKAKAAIDETLRADLATLEGALPEPKGKLATQQQKLNPPKPLSSKARQKLAISEVARFQAVLAHRAFKQAPMQALSEHLKNVVDKVNGRIPGTAEAKAAEEEAKAAAAAAAAAKEAAKGAAKAAAKEAKGGAEAAGGARQARKAVRLPRRGGPPSPAPAQGSGSGSGRKRKAGDGMEVEGPSPAALQKRQQRRERRVGAKLTPEQRAKLAFKKEKLAKVKVVRKERRQQAKAERRAGRGGDVDMAEAGAPAAKRARTS